MDGKVECVRSPSQEPVKHLLLRAASCLGGHQGRVTRHGGQVTHCHTETWTRHMLALLSEGEDEGGNVGTGSFQT